MGSEKSKRRAKKSRFPFLLVLPLQGVLNFLLIIPFALAIYLSLTNWSPLLGVPFFEADFIGGGNFAEILLFDRFVGAFANTLLILSTAVPLEFLIGLTIALMFYSWSFRGKAILAAIIITPMMMLQVVTGFIFQTLFFRIGPVNQFIGFFTGQEFLVEWVSASPATAMFAVVMADVWQWTPFMFLLLYAGMVALPNDPIRAARVLGASEAQIFRRIMLPLMKPIIVIAVIIRSLEIFKIFDSPFILTGGGPGTTTETVSIFLYKFGIEFGRIAFASSGAIFIFALIVIVTIFAARPLMPKRVG